MVFILARTDNFVSNLAASHKELAAPDLESFDQVFLGYT